MNTSIYLFAERKWSDGHACMQSQAANLNQMKSLSPHEYIDSRHQENENENERE